MKINEQAMVIEDLKARVQVKKPPDGADLHCKTDCETFQTSAHFRHRMTIFLRHTLINAMCFVTEEVQYIVMLTLLILRPTKSI